MINIKTLLGIIALSGSLMASAQQLPNATFDQNWVDCIPWTSNGNNKIKGTTPSPWIISQVIGMSGTGATIVGESIEDGNGGLAVKIYNNKNSVSASQIVPGYLTLGTTWSTATGMSGSNADGGTFGGIDFSLRPDAVSFDYQHTVDAGVTEPAKVIAYTWKGSTSQANVPGNIGLFSATKTTMANRDRNILGMATSQGGTVTKSADFELVSSLDFDITDIVTDWTPITIEIPYLTTSTPEKFNIIFSAGDYWERGNLKAGSTLCVDNVKLLYYSRLQSVSVGGEEIRNFSPDRYNYAVDTPMPDGDVHWQLLGQSGTASVDMQCDRENGILTLTVSNPVSEDFDGSNVHTYVIEYEKPPVPVETVNVTPGSIELYIGKSAQLSYEILPADADYDGVEWIISDPSIVSIDDNNILTALAAGTVTVNLKVKDVLSNDITVTAIAYPSTTYEYTGWLTLTANGKDEVIPAEVSLTTLYDDEALLTIHDFRYSGMRYGDLSMSVGFDAAAATEGATVPFTNTAVISLFNGYVDASASVDGNIHYDRGDAMCVFEAKVTVPAWDNTRCSVSFTTYPVMPSDSYEGVYTYRWNGGEDTNTVAMTLSLTPDRKDETITTLAIHDMWIDGADFGTLVLNDITFVNIGEGIKSFFVKDHVANNAKVGNVTVSVFGIFDPMGDTELELWFDCDKYHPLKGIFTFGDTENDPMAPRTYDGSINIEMAGAPLADGQAAKVIIIPGEDGTCTFRLPDFKLDMGGDIMQLGDIIVTDVNVTSKDDGSEEYAGFVEGLSLMDGAIIADVNLKGTISSRGVAKMDIAVMWEGVPINVEFNGNGPAPTGIGNTDPNDEPSSVIAPESDNIQVEYFNLNGIRVDSRNMTPGLYIELRGNETRKVIIK